MYNSIPRGKNEGIIEALVHGNKGENSRCVYQASCESEFRALQIKNWCDPDGDPSKERVMCSSIARDIGCMSVTYW